MKILCLRIASALFILAVLPSFSPADGKYRAFVKRPATNTFRLTEGNPYYIIVSKKDYELKVYDDEGWYATYPIVFGSKDLGDKMREGDRKTPTGVFKIIIKKFTLHGGRSFC